MENTNFWNKTNLQPPPITSYKTKLSTIDLSTLLEVLKEALDVLKDQSALNREAALLSRFIYCVKTKLRHNKAVKVLQKINQALLRYLRMNLVKHFQVFIGMIPHNANDLSYLPTRSMLHYLLVRLQGVAQLMVRLVKTSQNAAYLLNRYMNLGHLWKMLFLSFGMVSRIYVLSKNLARSCCTVYTQLLPFTNYLEDLKYPWLPAGYILPNDLKLWLNTDCLDNNMLQDTQVNNNSSYLSLLNNEDEWFEQNIKDQKKEISATKDNYRESIPVTTLEDLGIPLGQINLSKNNNSKLSTPGNKPILVDSIKSVVDLKNVQIGLKRHPKKYTNNFKKIDRMQYNMIKNLLAKYIRKIDKNLHNSVKVSEYLLQAKKVLHSL